MLRGEGGADYLERLWWQRRDFRRRRQAMCCDAAAGADEMRGDGGTDFAYYPRLVGRRSGSISPPARASVARRKATGCSASRACYGSYLSDRISGNAAANQFRGHQGADTLSGAGGADRFFYFELRTAPSRRPTESSTSAAAKATRSSSARMDANLETERQSSVPVHRQGRLHRRRPVALVPAERRHHHRGQHDRRHARPPS